MKAAHINNLLGRAGIAVSGVDYDPETGLWLIAVPVDETSETVDLMRESEELYPVNTSRYGSRARISFTDDPEQAALATWDALSDNAQAALMVLYDYPVYKAHGYKSLVERGLVEKGKDGWELTDAGKAVMEAAIVNRGDPQL